MSLQLVSKLIPAVILVMGFAIFKKYKTYKKVLYKIDTVYQENKKSSTQLDGQIIIVTGANTGIGYSTAKYLAAKGAIIIFACRDQEKAIKAIQKIVIYTKNNCKLDFIELDLNDLNSVKEFVKKFKQKYNQLNILINNAGVGGLYEKHTTVQNYEKIFGINHLGHFLLTTLLLDVIEKTKNSRIINLSSSRHKLGKINFEALKSTFQTQIKYDPHKVYGDSKLANIMFTQQLHKILSNKTQNTVKVFAVHPGLVRTEFFRYALENKRFKIFVYSFWPLINILLKTCEQGAQTTLFCSLQDFDKLQSGGYYGNCQLMKVDVKIKEQDNEELWKISEQLTNNY